MSSKLEQLTSGTAYLDAMILYNVLRMIMPDTIDFFRRIEQGKLQAFTASLTFDEVAYRLLLGLIWDRYGNSPLDRLRKERDAMIDEFYPLIEPQLRSLQHIPNFTTVSVTAVDVSVMHRNCRRFHLLPRDDLHLSVMQRINCVNLVSDDSDFDRVDQINRFTLH